MANLFKSDLCIGRSLSFAFGSYSWNMEFSKNNMNNLPEEPVLDVRTGLTINRAYVLDLSNLITIFFKALQQKNDIAIIRFSDEMSIPGHDVMICIIHKNDEFIVWYRNPWGYTMDNAEYHKSGTIHPMKQLMTIKLDNVHMICIQASMATHGPQIGSEECNRRDNPVEMCIADKQFGACVTWNEMYIEHVKDWVKTLPEHNFYPDIPDVEYHLQMMDKSLSFGEDSLTKLSEYGAKRWIGSPYVPYALLVEIFELIPNTMSDLELYYVLVANEKFMEYSQKHPEEDMIPQASVFIKESLGRDITLRNGDNLDGICGILGRTRESGTSYSCGEFIADIVLMLIACKIRSVKEAIVLKRKSLSTICQNRGHKRSKR